jgi:hypothetical protein
MSRVIVIEYMSLDGVMQDPDGREGTMQGGWVFRSGPEPVEGDKYHAGKPRDEADRQDGNADRGGMPRSRRMYRMRSVRG